MNPGGNVREHDAWVNAWNPFGRIYHFAAKRFSVSCTHIHWEVLKMPKRLTAAQSEELERLRGRCLATLDFLTSLGQMGPNADQFYTAVEHAYTAQSLRGLRAAKSDLDQRVRDLPPVEQERFNEKLDSSFGTGMADEEAARLTRIRKILQRGTIRGKAEYRLLLERVDQIFSDPEKEGEVERLNELLGKSSR